MALPFRHLKKIMKFGNLEFKTIDLEQHKTTCIKFREDSFVVSFGDNSLFMEADNQGPLRYIEWLRNKIAKDPDSAVHIFEADQIIGQMEMGIVKDSPDTVNIGLYYLVPEKRGQGYSQYLDQYATWFVKKLGLKKARLSVSPTNTRAIKFYERNGWKDIGPRPNHPEVHLMEKSF
jgi:RimJ/RimL family protein N-acetyltransferase